jgi:hypothetical protein
MELAAGRSDKLTFHSGGTGSREGRTGGVFVLWLSARKFQIPSLHQTILPILLPLIAVKFRPQ